MDATDDRLCASQRFLVREVETRGGRWELLHFETKLLEVTLGGRRELFVDIDASSTGYPAATVARDKGITKLLLRRHGVPVPEGQAFGPGQLNEALRYARTLSGPVVVKATGEAGGSEVYVDLRDGREVESAITSLFDARPGAGFLVERFCPGNEYRVLLFREGRYAVLAREPASVVGDGKHSLQQLAWGETYRRMNPRTGALGPIDLGPEAVRFLARSGRTLADVPGAGEKVFLRANSNVSTGGTCEDFTDRVHPSVLAVCKRALEAFPGLPYAGIDLLTADAEAPQEEGKHWVLEVNVAASTGMHLAPAKGSGRDVTPAVLDAAFSGPGAARDVVGPLRAIEAMGDPARHG